MNSVRANSSSPNGQILSVRKFLTDGTLAIPLYQRPYKWTVKNINQLFSDITANKDKSSYRLGTIVLHQEEDRKDIVDGQQRTITLLLAIRALCALRKDTLKRDDLKNHLMLLERNMITPSFTSSISKANIRNNYLEIRRIISRSDFTENHIDFLLNKCEVVTFSLENISEAFQFFDSQNARGRDLEPHDLLKAYHLRAFSFIDKTLEASIVEKWEHTETEELSFLFSNYLYRIRNWSKGTSARYFCKEDTDLFKGINMESITEYPYIKQLQIVHHFVNQYNKQYERNIDNQTLEFPFHLDQTIINGKRFFEMIAYYQKIINNYNTACKLLTFDTLDGYAEKILKTLKSYDGRTRTGDQYVRTIFDCLLIYYIDKFGHVEISRAIEKIFIWSFSLRLKMQAVQLASMDSYVLENNMFKLIKDAIKADDFINCSLPTLQTNKSTKTEQIEELFKEMGYYE